MYICTTYTNCEGSTFISYEIVWKDQEDKYSRSPGIKHYCNLISGKPSKARQQNVQCVNNFGCSSFSDKTDSNEGFMQNWSL